MRIRSILPKFYESEDVGRMDWDTRLVFIGLWSYVDDNGVGRDSIALIASDLFPFDMERDAPDTLARVSRALQSLSEGGQILRFNEGQRLIYIVNWDKYQRVDKPSKNPRYPRPTRDYGESRETFETDSRDVREGLAPGEGEKGRRGEEQTCASGYAHESTTPLVSVDALEEDFSEWWAAYPRKRDKKPAEKAYRSARKRASAETLLAGAETYAQEVKGRDASKIKHGATWLNGDCWLNEPEALPDERSGWDLGEWG